MRGSVGRRRAIAPGSDSRRLSAVSPPHPHFPLRRQADQSSMNDKITDLDELEQRMLAAERLLSTLVAILSARDPRLLDELQAVFKSPDFAGDRAGKAASATWSRISEELRDTKRLVDSLGGGRSH